MLEKIQNHPLTQAINQSLKPVFFMLFFASICALVFQYTQIDLLKQVAESTISCLPALLSLLLTYALTLSWPYTLMCIVVLVFHQGYLATFLIPLIIAAFNKFFKSVTNHHYFIQLPQFVENSVKDIVPCLFFLLLIVFPLPNILPLIEWFDSPYFFILIIFMNCLLFYKGYHPAVLNAVVGPIEIIFLAENIQAFICQQPLPHLLTHGAMSAMANLSGTGITIGIAFLGNDRFPKGTLLSSFFGVNEPIIFGLPIAMEKDTFLPFVVGGTINGAIPVMLMHLGYLHKPILDAPYLGIGLEGFLVNFDVRTIIVALLQVIVSVLIWYPYYRKKVKNHALSF